MSEREQTQLIDSPAHAPKALRVERKKAGWMDGWTDGRTDEWMDGRMDGYKERDPVTSVGDLEAASTAWIARQ